ncbi:MAG: hypothetical protein ABIP94_17095, partial [Planctomycetota bacterium]
RDDTRKSRDDRDAEKAYERATVKFEQVLESPDSADSGEGTSLHAVALLRVVEIKSTLARGYADLARAAPTVRSHKDKAKEFQKIAWKVRDDLRRLHAEAKLPNRDAVVAAAERACDGIK